MDEHARFRIVDTTELVRFRAADQRDAVAMWRLKRTRDQELTLSPFFYMAVMQRMAHACLVAEVAGEVVGYVIARSSDSGNAVRVVDLAVDATQDVLAITAGMLQRLVKSPAHAGARYVEADPHAHQGVRRLLHVARTLPLAKCARPATCSTPEVAEGAVH